MKAADVKKDTEQGYVVLVHGLVGDVTDSYRYHSTSLGGDGQGHGDGL